MVKLILAFVLLCLPLISSSLQEDISKLSKIPPSQRYKLMNKIKIKLSKLNAHQRSKTLKQLFKTMKVEHKNSNQSMQIHTNKKNNINMKHNTKNNNFHNMNKFQEKIKEKKSHQKMPGRRGHH